MWRTWQSSQGAEKMTKAEILPQAKGRLSGFKSISAQRPQPSKPFAVTLGSETRPFAQKLPMLTDKPLRGLDRGPIDR